MRKLLTLCSLLSVSLGAAAQEKCPEVIPALQQWTCGKGILTLPAKGIVVVNPADEAQLSPTARILAEDLGALMGWNYTVKVGKPAAGDIYLALSQPDAELGDEGYVLTVGRRADISAPTPKGVFWGTRTLLQIAHRERGEMPCGVARDFPLFPNRGFMLDVARKFFTLDYLRQYVKILSFYKFNEFQIHLNDNGFPQFFDNDWDKTYAAFRLESDRFPGLTAKDGSYTKREFADLQRMGMEYGVNVIPEIDVPAHSLAFVHYKPEIGSREYGMDHLDLYKDETYTFLDALFDEYLSGDEPVFVGPDIHIGTDEYNRKEAERYRYFTDRYLRYVSAYGKKPRMWGSLKWLPGETPVMSDGVTVNAWSYGWADPEETLRDGYKLINTNDAYLYIVPATGYYHDFLDHRWLYEKWTPWMMNSRQTLPEGTSGMLGAMFAVWNDQSGNGVSEHDVHVRSFPAVQTLSEKMWRGAREGASYDAFAALAAATPEAPGVNLLARAEGETRLTEAGCEVALTGRDSLFTALPEVGFPYGVSFSVRPDDEQNVSAVLFKGPHSTVYTNWENTGRIAFVHDGGTFVFGSYRLPVGVWTDIRIEGDRKGTSLYVGGELQERLEGRVRSVYRAATRKMDKMPILQTLVFPLGQIGDPINGFKGSIRDVITRQAPYLMPTHRQN